MNSSNPTGPNGRTRARRNRRERVTNETLFTYQNSCLYDPFISQTLERPQKTGVLWEPTRQFPLYPRRTHRAFGDVDTEAYPAAPQQSQPRIITPLTQEPLVEPQFSEEDPDALTDARRQRMGAYLSSWGENWATVSAQPVDPIPDIVSMSLEEPYPCTSTSPTHTGIDVVSESSGGIGPPNSPDDEDSVGGVAIPRDEPEEVEDVRQQPTAATHLAELKAKIPWLVEQRMIDGAGWRPYGEYWHNPLGGLHG